MNQPLGRVTALQYRAVAVQPGAPANMPVLRVHLRTHEDTHDHHDLPNGDWNLQNAALQFLANWGWQPTELDGTMHDALDDKVLVPIAPVPEDMPGEWGLAETAMSGAQEALKNSEWFNPDLEEESTDGPHSGPGGGGSPDPGTGNRGAVDDEEQGGVSAEMAGEDSDQGVHVTVE